MSKQRRVAVLTHATFGYFEGILRGISRFSANHTDWVTMWQDPDPELFDKIRAWKPDGIIANLYAKPQASELIALGVPIVSVSGNLHVPSVPRVSVDSERVAALAVEYLWGLGFRSFACLSTREKWFHKLRDTAFSRLVADRGVPCSTFTGWYAERRFLARDTQDVHAKLRSWLSGLPKPVALFGVQDAIALAAVEAAHECDIRVPDEMAVLGADDSRVLCELSNPGLSSIVLPLEQVGAEACEVLGHLMNGENMGGREILLPPVRVAERGSTDVVAVDDPQVASAMRFIRENAGSPISVVDILEQVKVSRRVLEQRFRQSLNCTPLEAIHNARMQIVTRLLVETELPMSEIANRAGLTNAVHLSTLFREKTGITPTAYRRRHRV